MNKNVILSLDKVSKHFGGVAALSNACLDIYQNEVVGIMGPNGAGKTTLLNVISGQHKPTKDKIIFENKDITNSSPDSVCHLGIARTFQIPQPYANMTVRENVMIGALYGKGYGKSHAREEADIILDTTDLSSKSDMLARDLSIIFLKRLEIARALAANPRVLLLDEVSAGLTEEEIPQFLELVSKMNGMGITIILIEHVIMVMMQAVHRIVVMDKGTVLAEGTPSEVMENEEVINSYFGGVL